MSGKFYVCQRPSILLGAQIDTSVKSSFSLISLHLIFFISNPTIRTTEPTLSSSLYSTLTSLSIVVMGPAQSTSGTSTLFCKGPLNAEHSFTTPSASLNHPLRVSSPITRNEVLIKDLDDIADPVLGNASDPKTTEEKQKRLALRKAKQEFLLQFHYMAYVWAVLDERPSVHPSGTHAANEHLSGMRPPLSSSPDQVPSGQCKVSASGS